MFQEFAILSQRVWSSIFSCLGPFAEHGTKEREPENSETLQKALAFMIPICTEFCEDKIDAADLKQYRDKCLKEQGINTRARKGKASKKAADAEA